MITFINANLGQCSKTDALRLIVQVMQLSHYIQKEAMDRLLESQRDDKLSRAPIHTITISSVKT